MVSSFLFTSRSSSSPSFSPSVAQSVYTDKSWHIPQLAPGSDVTLRWVCVFLFSCICVSVEMVEPTLARPSTASPTSTLQRSEWAFLCLTQQETELIYRRWSQMKRAALFKVCALLQLAERGLCPRESDTVLKTRSAKPLTSPWMLFFSPCYTFYLVKCETSMKGPQDLLADWQHKHSRKAARSVYFFCAEECSPNRDKDGSAYSAPR